MNTINFIEPVFYFLFVFIKTDKKADTLRKD